MKFVQFVSIESASNFNRDILVARANLKDCGTTKLLGVCLPRLSKLT